MGLRVNNNIASLAAQTALVSVSERLNTNMKRLSSGLRIASAADDAAGLAISERLRAQIRGFSQAARNANDGVSLVRTGDGAMNDMSSMLIRMRELAVQANNGTLSNADLDTVQQEFAAVRSELDRVAGSTEFNGINLLDGTETDVTFQIGSGTTSSDTITLSFSDLTVSALSLDTLDVGSTGDADAAIDAIDTAINTLSTVRGTFGAVQNRLETAAAFSATSQETLSAANSRIRDVDFALETSDRTRNLILQQSAISILSQANVQPQSALSLLA